MWILEDVVELTSIGGFVWAVVEWAAYFGG